MLNTIEEKLSAIKAINQQKDTIDVMLQRISLDENQFIVNIGGSQVKDLVSPETWQQLRTEVTAALTGKRDNLIEQAKQLMK